MKTKRETKSDIISFTITGNTVLLSKKHFMRLLTYLKKHDAECESDILDRHVSIDNREKVKSWLK